MNRNRKGKKRMAAGLAVSMAAVMGAVPVYAAEEQTTVSKVETVYVNADASGSQETVTVSNWLKNAGTETDLKDASELEEIVNVKGDETFHQEGESLTWNTSGADIYYQGKTSKELPVGMSLTYYLDGEEIAPEELQGKSGHLEIQINYTNKTAQEVTISGKKETIYSPFVMVTGMILPDDTFSNVTIDNGKIISDGSRSIVLGIAMPGMKESLGLDQELFSKLKEDLEEEETEDESETEETANTRQENKAEDGFDEIDLPDSLMITADVTDFSMSSTFTIALSDVLEQLDTADITDLDKLKDSLDDLEDAALKIVDGTGELSDGVDTLDEKYAEFNDGITTMKEGIETLDGGAGDLSAGIDAYTAGADQLNSGIQTYLGSKGGLTSKTKEFKKGVNTIVSGIKTYTSGTETLADGVTAYLSGEEQLAGGAEGLRPLISGLTEIKSAITQLNTVLDGKGDTSEDILAASNALAAGAQQLQTAISQTDVQQLLGMVDTMTATGTSLISQAETLSGTLQNNIAGPVEEMLSAGENLKTQLAALPGQIAQLTGAVTELQNAKADLQKSANTQVAAANEQIVAAQGQLNNAVSGVNTQIGTANSQITGAVKDTNTSIDTAVSKTNSSITGAVNTTNDSINNAVNATNTNIRNAVGSAQSSINAAADAAGDSELANKLRGIANGISGAEASATTASDTQASGAEASGTKIGEISVSTEVQKVGEISLPDLTVSIAGPDMNALAAGLKTINEKYTAVSETVNALLPALSTMQTQISSITQMKDQIPENPMASLSTGIHTLNTGMQSLNTALGTLSASVSQLNTSTDSLPTASAGIQSLLDGFGTLGENNKALTDGAAKLKKNGPVLVKGAETVQSATSQLSSGIGTLGSQLTAGAGQLAGSSSTLRSGASTLKAGADELLDGAETLESGSTEVKDGISELKDGADELKDGAEEFDEEGTSKLKKTGEDGVDELETILERMNTLNSGEYTYDTYSGKLPDMDGSVKFIIETAPIEAE